MKVRTQQNFNRKTRETVFGISIMPDGGRRYCKYPIGHQEYKDYTQAHQAMKDVQKIMAKNHVANSRGNPFQQDVVGILRALGHVTYDFKYRKCME